MQPELFQDFQPELPSRRFMPSLFPHRFIRLRIAYEDLIFCTLSLILVLLAGFCLGVERGKRLSGGLPEASPAAAHPMTIARERAPLAREYTPRVATAEAVIPAPSVGLNRTIQAQTVAPAVQGNGTYGIQLASYVGAEAAQAEAARLRRLGFTPLVIKQGKFFELRVVGFRSREEASGSLATLKKTYHDSFIKKLTS